MVTDSMLQGLYEAGASASEIIAYTILVRTERTKEADGAERYDVWLASDLAEAMVGMDRHAFSRALRGLTRKAFITAGGECVPVLTQTAWAGRRRAPHFFDNLGEKISTGQYPP